MNWTKSLLTICVCVFASGAATANVGQGASAAQNYGERVNGAYVARLDLRPLGIMHTEAMAIILHKNGTVNFVSEHEMNDLGSSGLGVWKRGSKRHISMGILNYRSGVEGVCQLIAVSPPDNCVLKLGAKLTRKSRGRYVGEMFLTVEAPDHLDVDTLAIPIALPMTMERMRLGDFPGAR